MTNLYFTSSLTNKKIYIVYTDKQNYNSKLDILLNVCYNNYPLSQPIIKNFLISKLV